ncbi:YkuS family protein [Tissierella praeacuta]|uniref:YkuS family protein n=1 Tax=Tissierella praeacuta TaxID=43131 RepID=UPI00289D4F00|nr:YkuS family protein [Tissierella praeacuta]
MKKIGVEKGLRNVADYLTNEGYSIEILSESIDDNIPKLSGLDAIVTAGYNTDMLGISDTETKAPVVNARGLTPEEVKDRLEQQLH